MAITIGGIVCQELVADLTEGFDRESGPYAHKAFLCPWANRITVARALLGLSSGTGVGGTISLTPPLTYPELGNIFATSIEIKGVGPPTQGAVQCQWTNAVVGVNYRSIPWNFSGSDFQQIDPSHPFIYAEQNISFTSEWITVPGKSVFYLSSGKTLDQDWGFRSPLLNLNISLKYVPFLPAQNVITVLAAPINNASFLGCAAGKLLFNGAENHQSFMSDGTFTQTVDYSFSYRPIAPWDYVYNGATNGWDQVVDSTSTNIQKRSNFALILPTGY